MEYFREVVCSRLGGSFNDPLWESMICKIAHSVAPIRNAVLALSLLWENSFLPQGRGTGVQRGPSLAALKHYSAAVSETRALLERGQDKMSTKEALICNLLFICFESVQQHYESALGQISSGLYLFQSWQTGRKGPSKPDEVESHLMNIFGRLITQSLLFIDTHLIDRRIFAQGVLRAPPPVPEIFCTLGEARDCLINVVGALIQQSISDRFSVTKNFEEETSRARPIFWINPQVLGRYATAFRAFKNQHKCGLPKEQTQALSILEMMYLAISVLQEGGAQQSETAFDQYQSQFEKIIRLGCSVLDDASYRYSKADGRAFDMELIPPLYFVAGRCRDSVTRREALRLLRLVPQQEGIWNGQMVAAVAEHIMNSEEKGLVTARHPEDIPVWKRLTLTHSVIDSTTRTITNYFSRPDLEDLLCKKIEY